jgi:cytochrome c
MGLKARTVVSVLALSAALLACGEASGEGAASPPPPPGNAAAGKDAIERYGCGGCHRIEGIEQAHGRVGPELNDVGHQLMIAGRLPTSAENLAHWVQDPQGVDPGVDMPNLGLSDDEARDIAAYLLTRT